MFKKILISFFALGFGILLGYLIVFHTPLFGLQSKNATFLHNPLGLGSKQVIGFLPYWLLDTAKGDYSKHITTLTYFGVSVDTDGTILKTTNPGESEPGYYALTSGKVDTFLNAAKKNNITLSLLVFNGDPDSISQLVATPSANAKNLVTEVVPIMQKYGFSDLNLDIEDIADASDKERINFTTFVAEVKKGLDQAHAGTLTIEVSPSDLIKKRITDLKGIAPYVDYVVLMAYDYHYAGSMVTGPVAPIGGAGEEAEFDVKTGVEKALAIIPGEKIILGAPLYGYEWETVGSNPRAAVIPGSGITASAKRVETLIAECTTCMVKTDTDAFEQYVIYKDTTTGTYHQIFYPDENATKAKVQFIKQQSLGGIAFWALGYEGREEILMPLKDL